MSSWKLAPCLQTFWDEINTICPGRDKTSDGSIGDAAHQGTDSDHNPDGNGFVCAVDTDEDTRAPVTMWDIVNYLVAECRKSNDVGLDRGRANYFIYERTIWRADGGWQPEPYTGSSPHDKHMHLSCEHDLNYVNDTRTWGLIERFGTDMSEQDMSEQDAYAGATRALTDFHKISKQEGGKEESKIGHRALSQGVPGLAGGPDQAFYEQVKQIGEAVLEIDVKLDQLVEQLNAHITGILEGRDAGTVGNG